MASDLAPRKTPRIRKRVLWFALIALALGGLVMFRLLSDKPKVLDYSALVVTKNRQLEAPNDASALERLQFWWSRVTARATSPRVTHSFRPSSVNHYGIGSMLDVCTEVSGITFVMPRGVASGSVQFAHTNTLAGSQWVQAFTEALQKGDPEWWDPKTKELRKENLILVTNDARRVLVLPREMVSEHQR